MSRSPAWLRAVPAALLIGAAVAFYFWEAGPAPTAAAADPGERVPLTASKVTGSPEPPPPYKAVNAFPKLKFDHPIHLTHAPGMDRLFVCEQGGRIYSFPNRSDVSEPDLFFDPRAELKTPLLPGTFMETSYALVFHPKFTENRQCFVCYTMKKPDKNVWPDGTRVSRFTVKPGDPPRIDPASEEVLLTWMQGEHNGCDLHFGPDGCLYISAGDSSVPTPPDVFRTGQDITDLRASILRIDVDRKDPGKNYAIPKDNPFVGLKIGDKEARGEVWAYGFRNPWRMCFDPTDGELLVGDVGWELWEMVHKVGKGTNSGWSITEAGRQSVYPDEKPGPTPIRPAVIALPHTDAASVTGGFVYRGKRCPELKGAYIFGDWMTRRVWAARIDGLNLKSLEELVEPTIRVVAFGEDDAGELYIVDHYAGTIHALEKNTATGKPGDFPRTLSATGLFASVKDNTAAPGVYPFEIAARQWQDHATAEHYIALPGMSAVSDYEGKKILPSHVDWQFFRYHYPTDAVLLKTISLEMEQGNPATRKRVETQMLHWDGYFWRAYTYAWRDDQSDADLVPADGGEKPFTIRDQHYPGGKREQTWTFNSRTQCLTCHNPWGEYTLGFNRDQLNRTVSTPAGPVNQLARLDQLGLVKRLSRNDQPMKPYTQAELKRFSNLVDPHQPGPSLEARAHSYLHANCGHCHRMGGGGAVDFELQMGVDLTDKKLMDAHPKRGDFGIPEARLLAKGDPAKSVALYRNAKFGHGRMPQLGSELVDARGVRLIQRWLAEMGGADTTEDIGPPLSLTPPEIADALQTLPGAEKLAIAIGLGAVQPDTRDRILAAAEKLPPGTIRDLFTGYLPQTGPRKLGPNPRPKTILAAKGDPARGAALFAAERMQCLKCHKIDGKGAEVGPDLSAIARQRSREELLESLLEPTRKVEPQYQSYLLRTLDGRTVTGVLVKRDAKEVIVRDAEGKEFRVETGDVEAMQPARESLMAAGLLADLTVQEAADLLDFLASRKGGP